MRQNCRIRRRPPASIKYNLQALQFRNSTAKAKEFEFQENDHIRTKILIDDKVTKQIMVAAYHIPIMTYTVNYKDFRIYVELFDKHLKHINNKKNNV